MSSQATCPLCDQAAEFETVDRPYGKRVTCPSCGDFFIDPSSQAHIDGMPEVTRTECRTKLRKMAGSCGEDDILVIRAPKSEELGGDGHSVARTKMIAEVIAREAGRRP
jgi:uncharacterized protein (DUF169 family)